MPTESINGDNLEELMGTLNRGGQSWSDSLYTGATLRVSFPQSLPNSRRAWKKRTPIPATTASIRSPRSMPRVS